MPTILEFATQIAAASSNLSINHFDKALAAKTLVLRPAFQRNLVWNDEQQSFLVDSILRGLPVPEVYVQTRTAANGDEQLIVVDGQQRISACLRFIHGDLRLSNSDDLDVRWRGRTFQEIAPDLQSRFRGFKLIVRDLPELPDDVLREVFRRLNKTVEPLEPQELRHAAYTGPFIVLIEEVAAEPVFTEVGVFSARDYLRRRNDEFIAEVTFAVMSKAYPNKKEGLDPLFRTMDLQGVPKDVLEDIKRRYGRVLSQLDLLASGVRRSRFRNKSDFYTLLVYFAKEAERLPLSPEKSAVLMDRLRNFSIIVNDIKKEEAEGRSTDKLTGTAEGAAAAKYLRAVERAASDRLSRVRREEALSSALGEVISTGDIRPLGPPDERWAEVIEIDLENYDEPTDEDKNEVVSVILQE
jgi:hypothetical protein